MKKFIAMLVAAACTLGAMATEYTGKLGVTVNGEGGSQEATITINQVTDSTYDLVLKNFMLNIGGRTTAVGNIELNDINGETDFGYTTIKTDTAIVITEGDLEDIPLWLGPMLGEVPLKMTASFNDQVLSVNIAIDMMEAIGQIINVDFIGTNPEAAPGPQGKKGDVTEDGEVDIADVNAVINIMLGKE